MQEKNSSWLVPFAIVVCVLLIGGAVYYKDKLPKSDKDTKAGSISAELKSLLQPAEGIKVENFRAVDSSDKILGSMDAPVKFVVYTDLECPACQYFHKQLKTIEPTYVASGKVAIVYRDFPLDSLHAKSRNEFLAAECVNDIGGNDKFWKFIDRIFEISPTNDGLDPAKLGETAKELAIDTKSYEACMSAKKFADKIQASVSEGEKLGVNGTPFFMVVAKDQLIPVFGALPADRLGAAIDMLISSSTPVSTESPTATTSTATTTAQ